MFLSWDMSISYKKVIHTNTQIYTVLVEENSQCKGAHTVSIEYNIMN